ncbi:TPA: hypothetical protein ACH3X1_011084 [Trebouxia sp. C0004]
MPQDRNTGPCSPATQHEQDASNPVALVKPRLRGVSHQYAAYIAAPVGLLLTLKATSRKAAIGSLVYTASLVVLFSISALYHRPTWQPQQRKWMRRFDHAAIFFLIAGTYTPICLLALPGSPGEQLLVTVWAGALIGVAQSLFWVTAPKSLVTVLYLLLGWAGVKSVGQLRDTSVLLVACGGAAYTLGDWVVPAAIVYAMKRPNPVPKTFGYHEIFHALVIVASMFHFTAVARLVMNNGL